MGFFRLTSASISYLSQFQLALVITVYLGLRVFVWKNHPFSKSAYLLIAFFGGVSIFSALLFLETLPLLDKQPQAIHLENAILGIILALLLQFVYNLSTSYLKQKSERQFALALMMVYALWEAGFAIWHFFSLQHGQIGHQINFMDYVPAIGFLWAIYIFVKNIFPNWDKNTRRRFTFILFISLFLTIFNILPLLGNISTSTRHIGMLAGVSFTLILFVFNFLFSEAELNSLEIRLANEQLLKLKVAVEQSPSSIIITDINTNIEYANPAFTRATGYTLEEVKGKTPRIFKSGYTPQETYKAMWQELSMGHEWRGDLANKKKNGEIFWEHSVIAPIYEDTGKLVYYVAIKEDITVQKTMEQALRESEEQYRQLFELESDAILIISNSDGRILQLNGATASLYGYSQQELLGMRNTDLSAEPENTQKATQTPFPIDHVVNIPLRWHRKKDGTVFPVSITARFITWKGESVHIAAIRDITEQKRIEEELVKLSVTDPLTEISNRRYFFMQADHILNRTHIPDTLAILMLDIDYFKQVNDKFGHTCGDAVLRQLTKRLQENLRPTDILARYGGEEFVILLPRTSPKEIEQITKRLWQVIGNQPFEVGREIIPITISIGVARLNKDTSDLNALISHADEALYQAKQAGRNQWITWEKR